jgi:LDH2 family malate/lactate/ureidoglycolate dehydrogenase
MTTYASVEGAHRKERRAVAENETETVVKPDELRQLVAGILVGAGMDREAAALTAASLVQTNLWGIDSHGVLRVAAYVRRLQAGAINGHARPHVVRSHGAIAILDGEDGAGFVVGHAAMRYALELADRFGVGVAGAINSNHFGAAGLYARLASDRDRIGIAMTNVAPNVVAPGGSRPVIGNNPVAIAASTGGEFPFVIDVSMSSVSGGKLLLASKKGERIPLDWATDSDGRPTDDPDEGFAGFLLPMGGFKGLGLAYAVDILCGVMTGGCFGSDLRGTYVDAGQSSKTGHMMIAIDPGAVLPRGELTRRMDSFTRMVKSAPMRDPDDEMLLPGELEHRCALRRKNGIPLPTSLFDELIALARELEVATAPA